MVDYLIKLCNNSESICVVEGRLEVSILSLEKYHVQLKWEAVICELLEQSSSNDKNFEVRYVYLWLLIVSSLPIESFIPQWKCNCTNSYCPLSGPPERIAFSEVFTCSITVKREKMILLLTRSKIYEMVSHQIEYFNYKSIDTVFDQDINISAQVIIK